MEYLIVGAEGYIGSYLFSRMETDKLSVIGTGHRNVQRGALVHYDVLSDSPVHIAGLGNGQEKTAIICIGQTNIDLCKTKYELSRRINVIAAKELIYALEKRGFYIIYFSTDNVFDGRKGNYKESDETGAVNEYGKMKEEMEQFLLEIYPKTCIFRLPKVLGRGRGKKNMLTDMEEKLIEGEVRCIRDARMSVISIEDIYQACRIASMRQMSGIYHLSTGEVYSRKEIAETLKSLLDIRYSRIMEFDLETFGFKDKRPLNIGLDNSKFKNETGYKFEDITKICREYLKSD